MRLRNEIVALVLAVMIFVSLVFSCLPLVSAAYTVENPYMPPEIKGDFNCDGYVDGWDLFLFVNAYQSGEYHPLFDLDGDGDIDAWDLTIFIQCYNADETEGPPIAYSTSFDFTVPDDGDEEVWYYVLARIYVSSGLSGQGFYLFPDWVNDWIRSVKINGQLKYSGGHPACLPPANVSLGVLGKGYHLLEFEFGEQWGYGELRFHVATASGQHAWLARFRIYVPNYSDIKYEYPVTTTTWCSMKDEYFLIGYADDYIDDVCVDGLVWHDWMWDMGEYGAIYAWRDGFSYPLGNLENNTGLNAYTLNFKFGEIWGAGLLDFQYVSWTQQRDRIGRPRFYAESDVNVGQTNYNAQITEKKLFGGSQWYMEAGMSKRYITTVQEFVWIEDRSRYPEFEHLFYGARVRLEIGIGWVALTTQEFADFGIMLNLTYMDSAGYDAFRYIDLYGCHVDLYTPQSLNIIGIEFVGEGQSKVSAELLWWKIVERVGVGILAYEVAGAFGAIAGILTGESINAIFDYSLDQMEEDAHDQGGNSTHRTFGYNPIIGSIYGPLCPVGNVGVSKSHLMFIRLNPMAQKHCGAMKLVLHGIVRFDNGYWDSANFQTTIIVPWFLP